MQAAETDIKNFKISDEDVNFRPSPNFKHMKKYFRDKFDEENSGSSNTTDSQSPTPSIKDIEKDGCPSCLESDQHPPLPPNPPPPDSPIVIKKEKEEQEEYISNLELHDTETLSEGNLPQYNSEPSVSEVSSGKSGETMCRNFIRGTCKKGAACIFVHKLILSQLKYVYRFCINFQNRSGCTRPQCKFVHATVFEQEHFYKTGYLPPHTMAHLKQENSHPPPKEEVPAEGPSVFINQPPPQIQLAAMETKPLENSSKVVTLDPRVISEVLRAAVETKLPLKREWSEIDDVVSSPRDITLSSPSAKKCKNCDFNEFRLQYIKRKCDSIKHSSEDITKKISLLNRKSTRLCTILISVLTQKPNSGSSLLNSISDKDSILVSQLSHLIGTNNRFSLLNEDSGKSNLFNNSIVAKLILSMRDKK